MLRCTSIAELYGIDPRTVREHVRKAHRGQDADQWETASSQTYARFLAEHYRLLLRLSMGLLDVVYQEPIRARSLPDGKTLLDDRSEITVRRSSDLLRDRGVDLEGASRDLSDAPKVGLSARFGLRLLNALWTHEPQLERIFDSWKTRWDHFREECGQLLDEAGGLLREKLRKAGVLSQKISDDDVEKLQWEVVREVLGVRLLVEEPKSSRVEVNPDTRRADLLRYIQRAEKTRREETRVYRGFGDVEAIREAYEWVFQQVSHEERLRPIEDVRHCLKNCIPQVETFVDDFVLRGRPRGQCPLCGPV